MKMDWTKDHVLQLIDLVRRRPCLYNIEHESFLDKKERLRAAADLAKAIAYSRPGTTIEEVLKKWDELCANFLSKHEHILQSRRGSVSRPYYYDKMSFVLDYISPKPSPKLLLERRDEKEVKSSMKCLFEKRTSGDKLPPSSRDKTLDPPPSEPAGDADRPNFSASAKSPAGAFLSDEDQCFPFSAKSLLHSPLLGSASSFPSQRKGTSDALLSPCREAYGPRDPLASRDESVCSQAQGSSEDDEDLLFMKYTLCRLKKLDETQKVRLKFEIDKLFYQVLSPP